METDIRSVLINDSSQLVLIPDRARITYAKDGLEKERERHWVADAKLVVDDGGGSNGEDVLPFWAHVEVVTEVIKIRSVVEVRAHS